MNSNAFFRKYGIVIILLFLVVAFTLGNPVFFTASNGINILRQISMLVIITIGMAFVLISGGIDLSVGAQLPAVGVISATLMYNYNVNPLLACLIGIGFATLVGLLNGLFISTTRVPPLIATLAMQQVLLGIAFIVSSGRNIYGLSDSVKYLGQGHIGPIPVPVIIAAIVVFLGWFILNKAYIGRYFYAIGSNEEVARLSGIDTKKVKTIAYTLSGFLSGLAAIIMMGRINSGSPVVGKGFEMDVLTAAVLGGISISGGEGKIFGAIIGALIIGVLSNGLIIMNVSEYYQMIIKGLVLALAIAFDSITTAKMRNK